MHNQSRRLQLSILFFFNAEGAFSHKKNRIADDASMSDREKMDKTGYGAQSSVGTDPNAHNLSAWPATSESSA
jgi:hypothetical protein